MHALPRGQQLSLNKQGMCRYRDRVLHDFEILSKLKCHMSADSKTIGEHSLLSRFNNTNVFLNDLHTRDKNKSQRQMLYRKHLLRHSG